VAKKNTQVIPTEKEMERANYWLKRATRMWEAKQHYSHRWEDYERTYKLFTDKRDGEDAWRESLADTWSFATIKTAQAAFVDSQISPVISHHEDDDQMKSRDQQDLYKDNAEKGNIQSENYYYRLDAFKLGTGFLKTTYVEDKRDVFSITKFDAETGTLVYKKEEVTDFNDPKSVRVSPWLMLVDDQAKADFGTARDCIELEIIEKEEAKRKYGHLIGEKAFDDRVKKGGEGWEQFVSTINEFLAQTADTNTGSSRDFSGFRFFAPFHLGDDMVVVWHCWQRVPFDTYEIIISGMPIKVHEGDEKPSPIPYIAKELPYSPLSYSPYSGDEFWGAGIIEIMRTDALTIKKNREMMNDRQKLSLFSPAFSNVNDEIDQRVLKMKPLSIIRTKGGVPQQYTIPGITNADLSLQDRNEASLKRAIGIDERVLGLSSEGSPVTATEASFLREAALKRLREFAFLYKNALLREVRLKLKLFEQYYASPLKKEPHTKGDGMKALAAKAHQFKVKMSDNMYTKRSVSAHMFEGDADIDIDMQVLVPMTQAQQITKWAQFIKDVTPFAQAGLVDIDLNKAIKKYSEALEVNINALRVDVQGESIEEAEGEHRLLANENTSQKILENVLPDGTPPQFLTAGHLNRHRELIASDDIIGENELRNLLKHIKKDEENFQLKIQQEQAQQLQQPNLQLGGFGGTGQPQALPANQPQNV
jgi:hypothetical protein